MRLNRFAIGLIATLTLTLAVGSASASRLSMSERDFQITWVALTFAEPASAMEVECLVALKGTFHSSTIRKVAGSLIGQITEAQVGAHEVCTNGDLFMLNGVEELNGRVVGNTLPWHVQYSGFIGALPNINMRVAIIGASILVESEFGNCLYRSTQAQPWYGIFEKNASNRIIAFRNSEANAIPLAVGILCLASIYPERSGGVNVLETTTSIFLRLI